MAGQSQEDADEKQFACGEVSFHGIFQMRVELNLVSAVEFDALRKLTPNRFDREACGVEGSVQPSHD
jgi:hypothetical protein